MSIPSSPGRKPAPGSRNAGRTHRLLLVSNGLDAAGGHALDTVLAVVVVIALGFGGAELGLLNALGSLSFLLLAVPIGTFTDAWGPARMLAASLGLKVLLAGTLLGLQLGGVLSTAAVVALATLLGVCTVASENAQTAVVPQVAGRAQVSPLVARMAAADAVAGIVTPGAAGLLLAVTAPEVPWSVALALLALALAAALGLRRRRRATGDPEAPVAPTEPEGPRPGLLHGFRVLAGNRLLLATTLLVTAGNLGLAIGDTVEPLLVLRHLDLGPAFFGLMGTVAAVSALAASAVAARVTDAVAPRRLFAVGAVVQAGVAALPLTAFLVPAAGPALLFAFASLWSVTLTVTNVAGAAFAAQAVPAGSLGRSAAARRTVTMGCVPVAALGGGLLADAAGLVVPLVLWPALTLAAAGAFFALTRGDQSSSGTSPAEV